MACAVTEGDRSTLGVASNGAASPTKSKEQCMELRPKAQKVQKVVDTRKKGVEE